MPNLKSSLESEHARALHLFLLPPTYQLVNDMKIDQTLNFVHYVISITKSFKSAEV